MMLAFWQSDGPWQYRVDGPHIPSGQRHVHVRRKRKRKGEYSWNVDGSRHDAHKFPSAETAIKAAREIASRGLKVPPSTFQLLCAADNVDRVYFEDPDTDDLVSYHWNSGRTLVILTSDEWIVLIARTELQAGSADEHAPETEGKA